MIRSPVRGARFCGACSQQKLHSQTFIHTKMCNFLGVKTNNHIEHTPITHRSHTDQNTHTRLRFSARFLRRSSSAVFSSEV